MAATALYTHVHTYYTRLRLGPLQAATGRSVGIFQALSHTWERYMPATRATSFLEAAAAVETVDEAVLLEENAGIEAQEIPRRRSTGFVLSDLILNEWYTHGFLSVITFGRQGVGKSVYNIKVAAEVLGYLNRRLTWKHLIDRYVLFSLDDMIDRLLESEARIPVLVWDDAGVHGSSYLYFIDKRKVMLMSALFQTARVKLNTLLMNTPNPSFILRHFRSVDSLLVLVTKKDKEWSVARGYRLLVMPSGDTMIKRVFIDEFKRSLDAYPYYYEKRKTYTDYVLQNLARAAGRKSPEGRGDKEALIAELLGKGLSYREIARRLHVSHITISQVKKKLTKGGIHV